VAIVARGLGQPDGPLVTGGYGSTEPAPPGSIGAHLTGTGVLAATLTDGATPPEPEPTGGGTWPLHYFTPKPAPTPRRVGELAAHLSGASRVFAEATTTEHQPTGFDDLALLLTLELV
jgi:hypothetical protein